MIQCHIFLTGGIGSGKSAVARLLSDRGALIVDTDAIGHELYEPEELVFRQVAGRWPEVVVDGRIDRKALGRIVFGDPAELCALEAITHPAIRQRVFERIQVADQSLVVVEVPLLSEFLGDGWNRVVVDAPDQVRVQRLLARGLDVDEINGRMAVQPDRETWMASADHVIDNAGSLDDLDICVDELLKALGHAS